MARVTIRLPRLKQLTGWSTPTVYRKIKEGILSPPHPLDPSGNGRAVGWFEDEVELLQEQQLAARVTPPEPTSAVPFYKFSKHHKKHDERMAAVSAPSAPAAKPVAKRRRRQRSGREVRAP
jgi:predicted DNA-binding transcriptional regulator AlpA